MDWVSQSRNSFVPNCLPGWNRKSSEIKTNVNLNWLRKANRSVKNIGLFKKLPAILEYEERTARFRKI